jgi:FMN-dependent NADH-azoreductase
MVMAPTLRMRLLDDSISPKDNHGLVTRLFHGPWMRGERPAMIATSQTAFLQHRKKRKMKILHVICSPRGHASESHKLSRRIIDFLLKRDPTAMVVNREIGGGGLPHIDSCYATALGSTQESSAERDPSGSISQSDELIRELESSDCVVIATPMHNFTVPSTLKAWIDHVVRVRRTFRATPDGYVGLLRDRPVFVAVSSGGRHSGQRAHQPDFLTPYLRASLGTIGLRDLVFFAIEGTALAPDTLADARTTTDQALQSYFAQSGSVPTYAPMVV